MQAQRKGGHMTEKEEVKKQPEKPQPAQKRTHHKPKAHRKHHKKKEPQLLTKPVMALLGVCAILVIFNFVQISALSDMVSGETMSKSRTIRTGAAPGQLDLSEVSVEHIQSTPQAIAAVFPTDTMGTQEGAMETLFPTGTPDYGEELGVSYDDPVNSLSVLARMYRPLKQEVEQNDPAAFQRYVALASQPKGVSCEYCCGIGPIGADAAGNSRCGCQHNPALLTVALYLSAYSDYNDAEIIRETMRWKTLFFPKNMIEIGMQIGGGDTSVLESLPGMVGGC